MTEITGSHPSRPDLAGYIEIRNCIYIMSSLKPNQPTSHVYYRLSYITRYELANNLNNPTGLHVDMPIEPKNLTPRDLEEFFGSD